MDWVRDKDIWPNTEYSRLLDIRPHRWHVQEAGQGPTLLLLHGAGGATQSWRNLLPILAGSFHVVAPDLPGQGFTRIGSRQRLGLRPLAEDIMRLCDEARWSPHAIIGHSAGAALALELARHMPINTVIGLNAALSKFEGVAGWLFPLMAKVMALNPLIPPFLARMSGGEARVRELLASTGSQLDAQGVALYQKLMSDKGHIDGTLSMMAQWNIDPLLQKLPEIDTDICLMIGLKDGTVQPESSRRAAVMLPNASVMEFAELGHLMHEDHAQTIADAILQSLSHESADRAAQ